MKKLFKTFALIALTSTTSWTASAKDHEHYSPIIMETTFQVGMYSLQGQEQVRLLLDKEVGTKLSVTLRNENGAVLYREFLGKKSTSYNKYFSLAELADGNYTFEIKNGSETIMKEVTKSTETVQEISIK